MATTATEPATARAKGELTPRQRKILEFIVWYWGEHMLPPSIREIMAEFGIKSPPGVWCHLSALHKKGWIAWGSITMRRNNDRPNRKTETVKARCIRVPELADAAQVAARAYLSELSGS